MTWCPVLHPKSYIEVVCCAVIPCYVVFEPWMVSKTLSFEISAQMNHLVQLWSGLLLAKNLLSLRFDVVCEHLYQTCVISYMAINIQY